MKFIDSIAAGLFAGLMSFANPVLSSDIKSHPKAVVELFTSQGCSSCPPADAYLVELDTRPDVLALAYHVDYWDYIGWKDSLGDASYSNLQRAYAQSWGKDRVYTPQVVLNGATDFVGSDRAAIEQGITHGYLPVVIDLNYYDGLLDVDIEPVPNSQDAVIYLVTFVSEVEVDIERGENRGKTISYAQVATSRQAIGMWDPENGAKLQLPLADLLGQNNDGVVVLVQRQKHGGLPGPILGASLFQM